MNGVIPFWVYDIPQDELETGKITKERFMSIIRNNASIPNSVIRNWQEKLYGQDDAT